MTHHLLKRLIASALLATGAAHLLAADITVRFSGLEQGDKANLTITSSEFLASIAVDGNGEYVFNNVPEGTHYVKAECNGYNVPEAQIVSVDDNGYAMKGTL